MLWFPRIRVNQASNNTYLMRIYILCHEMHAVLCLLVVFLYHVAYVCGKISCKDENNTPTDWYSIYKLPKLETEPAHSVLGQGQGYAYLNVGKTKAKWMLSEKPVSSPDSILANTLKEFYDNKDDVTYLLYNDDPGDEISGTTAGHTKGIVVFDEDTGFWLVHSIPKFPAVNGYSYPSSGLENGQSALCVTFKTEELNEIGKQLLFNHPNIYAKGQSKAVIDGLDDDVKSLFGNKPKFIKKPPFTRVSTLTSHGNQMFTSFSKDNQFGRDLYDSLVAPRLRTSLFVETWRRGSGTPLDPSCQIQYQVEDIQSINMTMYQKSKRKNIGFQSSEDHSKWAVSSDSQAKWVCIGDINRMQSQWKRGGGTVCFTSSPTWKAYMEIIAGTDHC